MDQNEACDLITTLGSDKSESSFNIVASFSNKNIGKFLRTSKITNKSELSFITLIPCVNQTEVNHLVAPPPQSELGYNTSISLNNFVVSSDKSETSCFNIDILPDFENGDQVGIFVTSIYTSESSFNIPIFVVDEMDPPVVSSNKSESSFNTNISSDFHNGNENLIVANTTMYGNETSHLVASIDIAKESFDFTNQIQELLTADSAMPYEKADESESSFNASISSFFASKETDSIMYEDADSHIMPFDLENHMPDRSPSLMDDSTYFHPSEFEDQSAWTSQVIRSKENQSIGLQLGDCHDLNFEDILNYNFQEIMQEGDFKQFLLSFTNCECPETSMSRDVNQSRCFLTYTRSTPDLMYWKTWKHSSSWRNNQFLQFGMTYVPTRRFSWFSLSALMNFYA